MKTARFAILLASMAAGAGPAAAAGQGLAVDADAFGPRWQARLQLNADQAPVGATWQESLRLSSGSRTRSAALFGDYFVANPWFGEAGGPRLTSGLLIGQRGALLGPGGSAQLQSHLAASVGRLPLQVPGTGDNPAESSLTWPYLGVGYSGSSVRGGFSFSADLGLAAQNPSAIRLGRMNASAGFDDWVRELRLTPLIQLGVSYRF